jgi:hypothetical protein
VWTLSNTVALYCLQQLTELTATAAIDLASAGAKKKQQQITAVHKAAT